MVPVLVNIRGFHIDNNMKTFVNSIGIFILPPFFTKHLQATAYGMTTFSIGQYIFHTIAAMVVMFKLDFVLIHPQSYFCFHFTAFSF